MTNDKKYKKFLVNKFKYEKIKTLFELDKQTIDNFKNSYRSLYSDRFIELSYVSEDINVFIEKRQKSRKVFTRAEERFIEDMCKGYYKVEMIPLDIADTVKTNVVLYKKLIDKLTDLRYSLEFEWGMKIPARFEMVGYDSVVRIVAQKPIGEALKSEVMILKKDARINFNTTSIIESDLLKKLKKDSEDKTWKFVFKFDSIFFNGPYIYYLFFNILFEQYLFTGSYVLPECVYSITGFAEYAKVFQRSRKLFNEFKESLPDDLQDCRCEMRAFADELIVEPSLDLVKKPSSGDLKRRYNEAFKNFMEQRLAKREIRIIYGQILKNDADYNLLKHFTTVLNAEIRLMERVTFEPLLVIAQEKLNNTDNVVLVGLKDDVNFVVDKLVQPVEKFKRIKVITLKREPIESVLKLFHEFYKNKHETRFIDFLFFRTYFDIRDNGLYQRIDLDMKTIQIKNAPILKEFCENLKNEVHQNRFCVINYGKSEIEVSGKSRETAENVGSYLRCAMDQVSKNNSLEIDFHTASIFNKYLEERFIYYAPFFYEFSVDKANSKLLMKTNLKSVDYLRETFKYTLCFKKRLGHFLYAKGSLKSTAFRRVIQNLNKHLTEKGIGFVIESDAFPALTLELSLIDSFNFNSLIEFMLNKLVVYIYAVSYSTYELILYKLFPQYVLKTLEDTVNIEIEFCNGHMLIFALDNDAELGIVIQKVNSYLNNAERF